MADTTFLLGAGINRVVHGWDGLTPPLSRDFFRQAFRHPRLGADYMQQSLSPLLEFIKKYWRMERNDLLASDLDLEECYTFAELQRREAYVHGDPARLGQATRIQFLLTELVLDYLSDFEYRLEESFAFRQFAELVYRTRASVLTFNYDTLLETQIENVSPANTEAIQAYLHRERLAAETRQDMSASLRQQGIAEEEIFDKTYNYDEVADEHVAFSHHRWNRLLAYTVRFDEVALLTPGLTRFVSGDTYYGHPSNREDHAPFLKLHGSLGWFVRSGYWIDGTRLSGERAASEGKTVVQRALHRCGMPSIDSSGEVLLPLIITPVLDKPYHEVPLLDEIWVRARRELRACKRLVIGGYSFPPTDVHVRFLLRDVFSEHAPEELCVINPDSSVVQRAKELCNYTGPVLMCSDLEEFTRRGA